MSPRAREEPGKNLQCHLRPPTKGAETQPPTLREIQEEMGQSLLAGSASSPYWHGLERSLWAKQKSGLQLGVGTGNWGPRGNPSITGTEVCPCVLIWRTSLCILVTRDTLVICVANIFSHSVMYLLVSLWCLSKNKSFSF